MSCIRGGNHRSFELLVTTVPLFWMCPSIISLTASICILILGYFAIENTDTVVMKSLIAFKNNIYNFAALTESNDSVRTFYSDQHDKYEVSSQGLDMQGQHTYEENSEITPCSSKQKSLMDAVRDELSRASDNLPTPMKSLLVTQGKMVRTRLIILYALTLLEVLPKEIEDPKNRKNEVETLAAVAKLAAVIHISHNASLLHDDVIDDADTRRGERSHCSVYGSFVSVFSGLALSTIAIKICLNGYLMEYYSWNIVLRIWGTFRSLVQGELLQLKSGDNGAHDFCNSKILRAPETYPLMRVIRESSRLDDSQRSSLLLIASEYVLKSYYKTASLFSTAFSCVDEIADVNGNNHNGSLFGLHFGLAFQIRDDLLDFTSTETKIGKPVLADLRAGNYTGAVILTAAEFPEIIPFLSNRRPSEDIVTMIIERFRSSNSILLIEEVISYHISEVKKILDKLPRCDDLRELVRMAEGLVKI